MSAIGGARVLIVGASMGAGHMTAAQVLAQEVTAHGGHSEVVDFLALGPVGLRRVMRHLYRAMLFATPGAYDLVMRQWRRHRRFFEFVTSRGDRGVARALAAVTSDTRPDLVVSTYNLGGQALGRLRARGALRVPVAAYVTDPGSHPYWVARGADRHLVTLPATAEAMRRLGACGVSVVRPLVNEPVRLTREQARERWQLPLDRRIALVNAGSWAVGSAAETAAAVADDETLALVLCGHSTRLRDQVTALRNVRAVEWTDDVASLIVAADVVVDNAGGTTCWEALLAGRPVVLHRTIPGHGRLNAETLQRCGLATVAADDAALRAAVRSATPPDTAAIRNARSALDVLVELL